MWKTAINQYFTAFIVNAFFIFGQISLDKLTQVERKSNIKPLQNKFFSLSSPSVFKTE